MGNTEPRVASNDANYEDDFCHSYFITSNAEALNFQYAQVFFWSRVT